MSRPSELSTETFASLNTLCSIVITQPSKVSSFAWKLLTQARQATVSATTVAQTRVLQEAACTALIVGAGAEKNALSID
jgi:hypothetical protein